MKAKNFKLFIIVVSVSFLLSILFLLLGKNIIFQARSEDKLQMLNNYSVGGDHPIPNQPNKFR